jgi:two-component system chemotaxis response regulator CheY
MAAKNILVVEDDPELLQVMGRALQATGHGVALAGSGEAGMKLFRADPPDVVVCDIVMPDRDGIELIPEMKTLSPGARILAISGRQMIGSLDVLRLAERLGADRVLAKPFEMDVLTAEVRALLDR